MGEDRGAGEEVGDVRVEGEIGGRWEGVRGCEEGGGDGVGGPGGVGILGCGFFCMR